jgi:dienelactone hydrolase
MKQFLAFLTLLPGILASGQSQEPPVRSAADLPSLLHFNDHSSVHSRKDWPRRREEIKAMMLQYFTGSLPSTIPAITNTQLVEEKAHPDGSTRRRIRLQLDTTNRFAFEIHVWIPSGQKQARPLLLTQPRDYQIPWAEMALKRGYVVCLYPGVDSHHKEKDYPGYDSVWKQLRSEYQSATWTEIVCKAWIASRCLDFLLDAEQGYHISKSQVGIIGFSRYGKQSLIATALDERITSVVARSPGSPGSTPYRFSSRNTFAEAPSDFPGEWFLPGLRSYTGREHELPMDAHGWLAMIAPRRCLIHTAHNDGSEPTFGVERAYLEARKVYQLHDKDDHLRVLYRTGQHGPITDHQREENLNWFDLTFDRGAAVQADFPIDLIHRFDWKKWQEQQTPTALTPPERLTAQSSREEIASNLQWSLGQPPNQIPKASDTPFFTDAESKMMTHDRWQVKNTARLPIQFGEGVRGNIYYNPRMKDPMPVVIWLHPYSYHSGYNEGYGVEETTVYHRLAQAGFAVIAYDQCGFGLRLLEGRDFHEMSPQWSRLGRMVHDVRAAVNFVVKEEGAVNGERPALDQNRIYALGYSLGGTVALYAGALDERLSGVASFSGFTPLRTDTDDRPTGGIQRLWDWHALQPKLGLFSGKEETIPFDYHDVLCLISPRPALLVTPQRDRNSTYPDIVDTIKVVQSESRDDNDKVTHLAPNEADRFQKDQHQMFIDWVDSLEKR